MSTYMLSLFIINFERLGVREFHNETAVTMYGRKEVIDKLKFAFTTSMNALRFYRKYFDMSYQIPKLGMFIIYTMH